MSYQPTVFVVDDDQNIISAFEDFLKKERCVMIAARSAEEALMKLEHHHVDLLITDVRLESRSGVTLFLQVKASYPQLPVIVVTGYSDLINEKQVKAYGADYFFLKPLELDKLRVAVRKCLK